MLCLLRKDENGKLNPLPRGEVNQILSFILFHYTMKKIYYAFSKIGGSGLFAFRKINKGEIIFRIRGITTVHHRYTPEFSPTGPNWLAIGKEKWLVPFDKNPWPYINHSCNPNSGFRGSLTIVAMKDVNKNEEITLDYSITEEDPYWHMVCHCGAKQCRKIIVSAVSQPELLLKYKSYLPNFLRDHLHSPSDKF